MMKAFAARLPCSKERSRFDRGCVVSMKSDSGRLIWLAGDKKKGDIETRLDSLLYPASVGWGRGCPTLPQLEFSEYPIYRSSKLLGVRSTT